MTHGTPEQAPIPFECRPPPEVQFMVTIASGEEGKELEDAQARVILDVLEYLIAQETVRGKR